MTDLVGALKEEIRRLARKEVKAQIDSTKRAASQHRRDIADLKRQLRLAERKIAFLESQERQRIENPSSESSHDRQLRFSPRWVKSHREKLKFTAEQYAQLVGVSPQSIYHWEQGKSRPRQSQLEALASIRALGRREALARLKLLENSNGRP